MSYPSLFDQTCKNIKTDKIPKNKLRKSKKVAYNNKNIKKKGKK